MRTLPTPSDPPGPEGVEDVTLQLITISAVNLWDAEDECLLLWPWDCRVSLVRTSASMSMNPSWQVV